MDLDIKTIDEYINRYPADIQKKLEQIRKTIREVAPEAAEKISYGLATFTLHGNLIHFGGHEKHIGFYPGPGPIVEFADDLKAYETSKGTVKFPLDKPLPIGLIRKLTQSAVKRNMNKKK